MERIQYLDLAKFFAIWLVIAGHYFLLFANPSNVLHDMIYSFHMPLFMMLSGFFAGNAMKRGLYGLVKNKAFHLLLPVVACTIGEIVIKVIGYELSVNDLRDIIIGNSWFLKTLFVIFVIVRLTKYVVSNNWIGMVVSCSVVLMIPHSYSLQLNWMLPFFWIGMIMKDNRDIIMMRMNAFYVIVCISLFGLCYIFLYDGTHLLTVERLLSNPMSCVWQFVTAIFGSLSIIGLSRCICYRFAENGIVKHCCELGKYTLEIYLIQTLVIVSALDCLCDFTMNAFLQECLLPIVSLGLLYVCMIFVNIIYRNKYFALVFFAKSND